MMDPEDVHNELLEHDRRLDALELAVKHVPGLAGMTLAQIEAMADRLGAAAKPIRAAQALLGGSPSGSGRVGGGAQHANTSQDPVADPPALDAAQAHRLRQLQPPEMPPSSSRIRLSPAEASARANLLNQFKPSDDPNLPDEIREMERGDG